MKIKNIINNFFFAVFLCCIYLTSSVAEIANYTLEATKLQYKYNNNILIAKGNAVAINKVGKKIYADEIIYDKLKSIIRTKLNSKYIDNIGNKIFADNFYYDLNLKKIKANQNVKYEDKNGNIFYFSEFEYNEVTEIGIGRDLKGVLADKSFIESKFIEINNKKNTLVLKNTLEKNKFFKQTNTYTTCVLKDTSKSINENCPDWSINTLRTKHDHRKKTITHNHAIIKIKNVPIFYTPYFSHPDPSVKRKSGFLPPSIKNFSDLGRTYKIPYFWALDKNADVTFTPIFYEDENSILLTEYRKQMKNGFFLLDTSYSEGYKKLNKKSSSGQELNRTNGSRNHLFMNYNASYDNFLLGQNDIEIKIQRISQKNYLNVNKINTFLVKEDLTQLNNIFQINSYKGNKKLKILASVYEDLNDDNANTKYEYKLPNLEYTDFFNKFNQNFSISSLFEANNYNGDTKKIIQRNLVETTSDQKIIKKIGLSNTIKVKATNINHYNENVDNSKNNLNNEYYTTVGLENSLPLIKLHENSEQILSPKVFTKFTTGSMRDKSNDNKILEYADVYSMDRLSNIEDPETGFSIGYGFDYNFIKKNIQNVNYLKTNLSLGQVLSDVDKVKMPNSSSLDKKSSNIVGNFNFFLNGNDIPNYNQEKIKNDLEKNDEKNFIINYNFNISDNFKRILKNDANFSYTTNHYKFNTSYYELNEIGSTHYIESNLEKKFQNNINFLIGTRNNLRLDYTENNYIETNYDSDCLKVGFRLTKNFYQNDDVNKTNNLLFFISLKPFGQPISPDLSSFIN